ncbi:hypothetical protein ACFXPA_22130 [Amycolatopsis sp. NPDC059090]|uniref:hypothetical protein n=1 Tax=unclassified Amycolatopsis TaxID=2618356 RepID=UPI00366AE811
MSALLLSATFVPDPSTSVDDLANAVHTSAFDLLRQVLPGLRTSANIDPLSAGFLGQYAGAAGLGLVVMAFFAILTIVHSVRGGGGRADLAESLFKYLPLAVFLIVFSPAIGVVLENVANAATDGISRWGAGTVDDTKAKIEALGAITADKLPGGTFVGLLVSALVVAGALGAFLVLAVQKIGMPVAGIVAGISWGMLVHPTWRPKAVRAPSVWLGLMFAKPVLFLLLAAAFGAFGSAGGSTDGVGGLIGLCLLAVALLIASAVPLVLVRRFPRFGGRSLSRSLGGMPAPAPLGLHGPVAAVAERTAVSEHVVLPPLAGPEPPPSHTIEQAYEHGRQRDRGDAKTPAASARRPSHLEEAARTENLFASSRPRRR